MQIHPFFRRQWGRSFVPLTTSVPDSMKAALYALVPEPFNTSQAERVRFALHVGIRCMQAAHGRKCLDFEKRLPELQEVVEAEAAHIFEAVAKQEEDKSQWQQTATREELKAREVAKMEKTQEASKRLTK